MPPFACPVQVGPSETTHTDKPSTSLEDPQPKEDDTRDQHCILQLPPSPAHSAAPDNLAGLVNNKGDNNCFVNVVVQCLRSCEAFMELVQGNTNQHKNPVVQALLRLFAAMEQAERGWQQGQARSAKQV